MTERRRVLLVDDTVTPRTLLQVHLMGFGFDFEVASDGREGLEKARRTPPDLIISDIRMPRMTGIELCEAIRSDRSLASTPVVLLTSDKEHQIREAGRKAGATAFLRKPVDAVELRRVVSDALGLSLEPS